MTIPVQKDAAAEKIEERTSEDLLRDLLTERQAGAFVSLNVGRMRTEEMIARKRAKRGL